MANKPYNGHPSWNAWNVALWIGNDEGLYRMACDYKARFPAKPKLAARLFCRDVGTDRTPDGGRYNPTVVAYAMRDL